MRKPVHQTKTVFSLNAINQYFNPYGTKLVLLLDEITSTSTANVMKKKVLLIDDIKEFRALVKIFLSEKFEVVTAKDGLEALAYLENGMVPDAIVTDLMMPRLDGYQLISRLKNDGHYKKIPVIVLSNIDKRKEREELQKCGISGYLIKPFSPNELREGLEKMLSKAMVYCN
jgi:CheY-like chemotaxis protein